MTVDLWGLPHPPHGEDWQAWVEWANTLPHHQMLGLECLAAAEGRTEFRCEESAWPLNPNGSLNGGLVLALADWVAGFTCQTALTDDAFPNTASLNAEFLRLSMPPLTLRGELARRGSTMLFVSVNVLRSDGEVSLRAHGIFAPTRAEHNQPRGDGCPRS